MKVIKRKEVTETFAWCPKCNRLIKSFMEEQKKKTFKMFLCSDCDSTFYPEQVLTYPRGDNEPTTEALQGIETTLDGKDTDN